MHTKLNATLLSILLILPTYSMAKSSPPKYCPGIQAIKSVPLTKAQDGLGGWMAYNSTKNSYDTSDEWTFVMFVGQKADNENDAVNKANAEMAYIAFVDGPNMNRNDDGTETWGCTYMSLVENHAFLAIAMTPALTGLPEVAAKFIR